MAVLMTHRWPGGTEAQYRATIATVHPPDGLPEGQLSHTAGVAEGGYLIAVVWGAKEMSATDDSSAPTAPLSSSGSRFVTRLSP